MGASWSIAFVSAEGDEVSVPVDTLCAASPVWRERIRLASWSGEGGVEPIASRCEEGVTTAQVKAFAEVIATLSHEATRAPEALPLETLVLALPLIHKYDCAGVKMVIESVARNFHFDEAAIPLKEMDETTNSLARVDTGRKLLLVDELSQAHVDFIITAQELYGADFNLSDPMKRLLALLLTYPPNRIVRGYSGGPSWDGYLANVTVEKVDSSGRGAPPPGGGEGSNASDVAVDPIEVQAWRLTATTYASILKFMRVRTFSH